jgi:hypothetical protein
LNSSPCLTSLIISCEYNLPNLNAIRISNLSCREKLYRCYYDVNILNKSVKINKITKLTLRYVLTIEQINLIIQLFLRIQYSSLQHIFDRDIESIVRYTSSNIKKEDLSSDDHLCF